MKDILYNIQDEINFDLNEIDIESDRELFVKYKDKIPVLIIDGKMFAKYRIDEKKLRKKIANIS